MTNSMTAILSTPMETTGGTLRDTLSRWGWSVGNDGRLVREAPPEVDPEDLEDGGSGSGNGSGTGAGSNQ